MLGEVGSHQRSPEPNFGVPLLAAEEVFVAEMETGLTRSLRRGKPGWSPFDQCRRICSTDKPVDLAEPFNPPPKNLDLATQAIP